MGYWGLPLRHLRRRSRHPRSKPQAMGKVSLNTIPLVSRPRAFRHSRLSGTIWSMPARLASVYFAARIVAPPGRSRAMGVTDPFILTLTTGKDDAIYAGTFRGGVFRSRDRGKSWQAINSGLKRLEIKALLAVGDGVYAGTGDGVYRLAAADRWSVVTTGLDDILVHALALSSDGTLFAGTSGKGIVRFKAQSTGWVRQQNGLKDHEGMTENFIRVLTIDPEGGIYAGTFDGGVFRSADGGVTWRPISRALPNDSIRGILFNSRGLLWRRGTAFSKRPTRGVSGCRSIRG